MCSLDAFAHPLVFVTDVDKIVAGRPSIGGVFGFGRESISMWNVHHLTDRLFCASFADCLSIWLLMS